MIFYTEAGIKEFTSVTKGKSSKELNADDFRHFTFCSNATEKLTLMRLQNMLKNGDEIQRAKAGIFLHDYWLMNQKNEKVDN